MGTQTFSIFFSVPFSMFEIFHSKKSPDFKSYVTSIIDRDKIMSKLLHMTPWPHPTFLAFFTITLPFILSYGQIRFGHRISNLIPLCPWTYFYLECLSIPLFTWQNPVYASKSSSDIIFLESILDLLKQNDSHLHFHRTSYIS